MDKFSKELDSGEIHFRDRWQFELKSDFIPDPKAKESTYTQDYYIFIPNALQVNDQTYSRTDFYRDQTNFIRYKTPAFPLKEIISESNSRSPMNRIRKLLAEKSPSPSLIEDEIKLLANIFRSALREKVRLFVRDLDLAKEEGSTDLFTLNVLEYFSILKQFRIEYASLAAQAKYCDEKAALQQHFYHVDAFISSSLDYYLSGFLALLRKKGLPALKPVDEALCEILIAEKQHRERVHHEPNVIDQDTPRKDYILYQKGLLNKYVLDALYLNTSRSRIDQRYGHLIGSLAAGIAMLFFFVLFVLQGEIFLINSTPFILMTVILYIFKDRMKEGLKSIWTRQASRWFADFTTFIYTPGREHILGSLRESFSFISEKKIPREIIQIRNREFHEVLEEVKRPERVIYFKKRVTMKKANSHTCDNRRQGWNVIFRFNILHFLEKAANPYHTYLTLNPETRELVSVQLPKVYHLNIIMKNAYRKQDGTLEEELKKFRIILDKNGIKSVEPVSPPKH